MVPSVRDITFQLRQGQLVALADETGWSIAADPVNDTAVRQLLTLLPALPEGLPPTMLIQNADQLTLYVAKLPDIAYDLVEFAENPLTVIYEQGKNVSPVFWESLTSANPENADGFLAREMAIRRSLSAEVQRLIGGFGRGLLTIPFEALTLPSAAESLTTLRFGALPGMPKRPRIMRLKANGGVSFLRK